MAEQTPEELARENKYLRLRVAQLEDDVTSLGAETVRLRQIVERMHGRTPDPMAPNPLSGGQ